MDSELRSIKCYDNRDDGDYFDECRKAENVDYMMSFSKKKELIESEKREKE